MSLAIDIAMVLIALFFAWRGFRNGFIRGVLGILAVIIALYGANLVAKTYSDEFTGMLKPFVSGVIDNAVSDAILKNDVHTTETDPGASEETALPPEETEVPEENNTFKVFDISFEALRKIGVSSEASSLMAEKVGNEISTVGQQMTNNLTDKLCTALAYILVFAVSFILIAIVFAIIGNLINLVYILPGIEMADRLIGLILGLLKGALIIFAIAVIIRYLGLLSPEAIGKTTLLKFLTDFNPLADILGI